MGPVLRSGDLPGLFIPFWIFRSKDVHCAVIAGHADEGRVLIEVNAAETPGGIGFHGRKGSPAPARSPPGWLAPPPSASCTPGSSFKNPPSINKPQRIKARARPRCNSRALLGCTDAQGCMPRTGRDFLQPPGACHSGEKSPRLQSDWRWGSPGWEGPREQADRSAWGTPQRPRGIATTFISTILTRRPSAAQHPQKPQIQNEVLTQQGSSHLRAAATRRGGNHQSLEPQVTTDEPTQALGWALKPCKNKQEASDMVRSKWPALIDAEWGGGFTAMTILFLLCIRT